MDWIRLAQDMDQWQALVNKTVGFHKRQRFSCLSERLLASPEELGYMKLMTIGQ
jgi:hypothetical protein